MTKIMVWAALSLLIACGEQRPSPKVSRSVRTASTADATPGNTPTTVPVTEPAGPFTGRMKATATELSSMRELYVDECSICHSALDRSTKRAVTLARLNAACVPMAVPLHSDILQRNKWPRDVNDTKDDGVDTAVMNASALVEVLK